MLADFKNLQLEKRFSIASIVYGIAISSILDRTLEKSMTDELENKLDIQFSDSVTYLSTNGYAKCIEQLSDLTKNEKEKLLLVIVEILRKSGNVSKMADPTSKLFNKLGLSQQEQMTTITQYDSLQKNEDGSYKYAKQIIRSQMQKEVETEVLKLFEADPLKDSPLEGMSFLRLLTSTTDQYKELCLNNKAKLGINDSEVKEIFQDIFDELHKKYLNTDS